LIVYVESNFLLELALAQEQHAAAEQLLLRAEAGAVTLVVPAFALSEPFATVTHRAREQRKLHGAIREKVRDLSRSPLHSRAVTNIRPVMEILLQLEHLETTRLTDVVARTLTSSTVVELTSGYFHAALVERERFSLSVQDAVVYACIMADARSRDIAEPKCFISRNDKDFGRPDILAELHDLNCRYAATFDEGLEVVNSFAPPVR
jgi:predicted nucleic acid-binding protein